MSKAQADIVRLVFAAIALGLAIGAGRVIYLAL